MGCGCRKGNQAASIKKTLSLEELRAKVSGIRGPIDRSVPPRPTQSRVPTILTNSLPEPIFKVVQLNIDPNTVTTNKKTVLLVANEENTESKYLKNVISKLASTKIEFKNSFDFLEIKPSYLLNSQDITRFPCTILISRKSLFKKYFNLFDVHRALDEFLALKDE